MKVIQTEVPGVLIVEPKVFGDARGFFFENYSQERYAAAGIPEQFVQDNVSLSQRGVLRGLHLQWPNPQGKLVSVLRGEVYDVAVDVRVGSPSFGQWVGVTLSCENRRQFWVPPGFAHGFQVVSDEALFAYKCTDYYHPEFEASIAWDDPELGIRWPVANPSLSAKDRAGVRLRDLPEERRPRIEALV